MHDEERTNRDGTVEDGSSGVSPALIAWGVAAALAIAFILQNQSKTDIDILFWSFRTSVWVAIVIAMALGALLGWFGLQMLRRRRQ